MEKIDNWNLSGSGYLEQTSILWFMQIFDRFRRRGSSTGDIKVSQLTRSRSSSSLYGQSCDDIPVTPPPGSIRGPFRPISPTSPGGPMGSPSPTSIHAQRVVTFSAENIEEYERSAGSRSYVDMIRDIAASNLEQKLKRDRFEFTAHMDALVILIKMNMDEYHKKNPRRSELNNFVFSYTIHMSRRPTEMYRASEVADLGCFPHPDMTDPYTRFGQYEFNDIYDYFSSKDNMPFEFSNLRMKLVTCGKVHTKGKSECKNVALELKFTVYETKNFFKVYNGVNDRFRPYVESLLEYARSKYDSMFKDDERELLGRIRKAADGGQFTCVFSNSCPTEFFIHKLRKQSVFNGFTITTNYSLDEEKEDDENISVMWPRPDEI
jgi:hypothetical protein